MDKYKSFKSVLFVGDVLIKEAGDAHYYHISKVEAPTLKGLISLAKWNRDHYFPNGGVKMKLSVHKYVSEQKPVSTLDL